MISFKNLLPKILQDTRWGELIEVWQSIYVNIKEDKINPIFNQYHRDYISTEELYDLANMFGFYIKSDGGYTLTRGFLLKELETLVPRIKAKATRNCYILQGVPFNLISRGYNVLFDDTYSNPLENTIIYRSDESLVGGSFIGTTYLDREHDGLSPSYLDTYYFPSLDSDEILTLVTRNFIFNYIHKCTENSTEFMSLNTLTVLMNDINQFKRMTDRCYYEPYLFINLNSNRTQTNKQWVDYTDTNSAIQRSILIANSLSDFGSIRFGTGGYTTLTTGITDVQTYNGYTITYNDANIDSSGKIETSTHYNFRRRIVELQKIPAFSELIILNGSGSPILYSTFPLIQWNSNMFNNVKFDITVT